MSASAEPGLIQQQELHLESSAGKSVPRIPKGLGISFPRRLILFALVYWAGAEMVYATPGNFADFWLPGGIYLALLLRTPSRRWWAVSVTAGAANLLADVIVHGQSWRLGAGYMLLNVGLPAAGATLLARWCRPAFSFARLPHVLLWGLVISFINSLLSSAGGAALKAVIRGGDFRQAWELWWIGDLLGMLVAMPLTLGILDWFDRQSESKAVRAREGAALFLSAGLATWLLFRQPEPTVIPPAVLYLFLMWAALRLGATGVAATSLLVLAISLWLTAAGSGPYSLLPAMQSRMLTVQLLIAVGAFFFYILAAVMAERRAAENELRQSNVRLDEQVKARTAELADAHEQLEFALKAGGLGHWHVTLPDFTMICSDLCRANFGVTPADEFTYPIIVEMIYPADRARQEAAVNHALATGEDYAVEYRITTPMGEPRWIDARGRVGRGADGQPLFLSGTTQNITERKQAEERLRASEERFAKAFNASPTAITLTSLRTGRLLEVNDTFERAMGFRRAEAVGKTTAELGLWDAATRAAELAALQTHGRLRDAEYKFRTRDGAEIIGLLSAELLELNGEPCALTVVQDITARKQAEDALRASDAELRLYAEKLEHAAQTARLGFWELDLTNFELTCSAQSKVNFGVAPDEEISFARLTGELIHPDDRERMQARIKQAIENRDYYEAEYRAVWSDGSLHWIHARGRAFYADDGTPVRMVGVTLDITARKQAEEGLRQSEERFRLASDVTHAMVYDVDYQTPEETVAVYGAAALLGAETPVPITRVWYAARIHPDDLPLVGETVAHAADGAEYVVQYRLRHAAGHYLHVEDRGRMLLDAEGRVVRGIGTVQDVTARKQAETALRESEARLRLALEASFTIAFTWDIQRDIVRRFHSVDPVLATTDDAHTDTFENVVGSFYADDRDAFRRAVQAALDDPAGRYQSEHRIQHPDSALRWYAERGQVEFAADGTPLRLVGLAMDITERKHYELNLGFLADLQKEFVRPLTVAQIMETACARISAHFQLAHCLFVEIDEDEAQATVLHDCHSDALPSLVGAYAIADFHTEAERDAMRSGQPIVIHDVNAGERTPAAAARFAALGIGALLNMPYHSHGRWRFVLSVQHGRPHHWREDERALLSELAERLYLRLERARAEAALQASEEAFRVISNAAPALVWVCNQNGENIYFNERWSEYTGQSVAEAAGYGWATTMHPDDAARILPFWEHCRATGEPYEGEVRYRRHDGEYRWHDFRALPRRHAGGAIAAWYGLSVDVHERKQFELEREQILLREQQAREIAEAANRAKDDWLAMVTHELRSPLNAILGHARLLQMRRAQLAVEFNEFADMVRRNGERQNELINDLLDTARMATGKLQLELGTVELVGVVLDALDSVRPAALARQVALLTDLDAKLGTLNGDAARLQQVVWNLLTNAVKFTPAGGSVHVGLRRDGEAVVLTVRDTGQGIAADFLPHVFERFSQQDTSRSRRHGGLGLGLSLVKQIVELHGGGITAASDGIGCGTTFTVTLPLGAAGQLDKEKETRRGKETVEQRNGSADSHFPASSSLALSLVGVRALVVEDDADARALVAMLLESFGAEVRTANDAAAAWEALTQGERPHVLVCDIALPEEDGLNLLRRWRRRERENKTPPLPALALTAQGSANDRLQSLQAGFQMHLTKPVEPEELALTIKNLLARAAK